MSYQPRAKTGSPIAYGKLITETLHLIWRHKFLWFFGFFTGSGFSGGGSWNFNYSQSTSNLGNARVVTEWVETHLALIIAAAASLVLLALLFWLWSLICQGAIIGSVRDIYHRRPAGFKLALAHGRQSFSRLLLLNLLLVAIGLGLLLIVAAIVVFLVFFALFLIETNTALAIAALIMLLLWLAAILVSCLGYLALFSFGFTIFLGLVGFISVLLLYSLRAIVLEGARPVAALQRGWQVLKQYLKHSILLFLLGAALGTAGGLLILIVTAVAAIPAIIAWALSYSMDFSAASVTVAALLTLPAITALTLAIAANNTYFSAYWTKAYLGLTGADAAAGPDGSPA